MVFIWLVVVVMQQQTWTIRHPNATGECAGMSLSMASMPVNTVGNWMLPIDTQNAPRIAKTMIPNSTHLFSLTLCLRTDHNCLPSDPTTRTHWMRAREERQRSQLKNGKRYVIPHSLGVCP